MFIPSPYHNKSNPLKAFVLGCDPTAFDKAGKQREFEYVFDIKKDKRYFTGINANLKGIGLDQECVYIQNLIEYSGQIEPVNPDERVTLIRLKVSQ